MADEQILACTPAETGELTAEFFKAAVLATVVRPDAMEVDIKAHLVGIRDGTEDSRQLKVPVKSSGLGI